MDMNRRSVLAGGLAYGGMAGLPGLNHLTDTLAAIRRLRSIGIRDRPTSPRSPWQNGYAERLIGSIRRECLDQVVVFGERHLLLSYMKYYNEARTHLSLEKDGTSLARRRSRRAYFLSGGECGGCRGCGGGGFGGFWYCGCGGAGCCGSWGACRLC